MTDPTFGETIRQQRKAAGLTQRALAAKLGCDFSYISKIENDKTGYLPSASFVLRLGTTIGADVDDLLIKSGKVTYANLHQIMTVTPELGTLIALALNGTITREQVRRFLQEIGSPSALA